LVLLDPNKLFKYPFEKMTEEIASIFEPIGVEISWRRTTSATVVRERDEVLVVLLDYSPEHLKSDGHVMGAVVTAEGSSGSLFIYVPNVARSLGYRSSPRHMLTPFEKKDMARALGRVIAHELVHSIAPPHPHVTEGLMKRVHDRASLLGSDMEIGEQCATAFFVGLSERDAVDSQETAR
jgi:hypothetical protein